MEFPVLAHIEQTSVRTLRHFLDGFLNRSELIHNIRVVTWLFIKVFKDFQSLIVAALHHQPPRRFGQVHNRDENHHREEDLEGQWETPCHLTVGDKRKS